MLGTAAAAPALRAEAQSFARYLVGTAPSERCVELYARTVLRVCGEVTREDARLVAFAGRRPWSIGLLDAGLALLQPHAELRRRLFLMFAILEATPEHHQRFLPARRSPPYLIAVVAVGMRAVLKAIFGVGLVVAVRR